MKWFLNLSFIMFFVACSGNANKDSSKDSVYSSSNSEDTSKPNNLFPKPGETAIGDTSTKESINGENTAVKKDSFAKH